MTVVMTMMVRDEADIIAATIEHHLAQGIDRIIVTDNASVDGTREILAEYARVAPVTVLDDPEHRKQQGEVVTRMARRAATEFGASWVINGDADEFVLPTGPGTVAERLAALPRSLGAVSVPVVNLVGPTARSGSGIATRLLWRDERDEVALRRAGVHAHPSPNIVHVGSSTVTVGQGNHATSIASRAPAGFDAGLEVAHLPWRSWTQFERKTVNMGRGYEANPELLPSPNHHGMRDWRRWKAGTLLPVYVDRALTGTGELGVGFRRDERLLTALRAIDAILPARLAEVIDPAADEPFAPAELAELRALAAVVVPIDVAYQEQLLELLGREHALATRARDAGAAQLRAEAFLEASAARTRRLLGPFEPLVTYGPGRGAWYLAKRAGTEAGRLAARLRG